MYKSLLNYSRVFLRAFSRFTEALAQRTQLAIAYLSLLAISGLCQPLWAEASTPFPPNQSKTLDTQLPGVHFTDDQGKPFLLSDLKGTPLLIAAPTFRPGAGF